MFDTVRVIAAPFLGVFGAGVVSYNDSEYATIFVDKELIYPSFSLYVPYPIQQYPLAEKIAQRICGVSKFPEHTMIAGISEPRPHFGASGAATCRDLFTSGILGVAVSTQGGDPGILTAGHVAYMQGRKVHSGDALVGSVVFTMDPTKAKSEMDECADVAVVKLDENSRLFESHNIQITECAPAKKGDKLVKYCSHDRDPNSYRTPTDIHAIAPWLCCKQVLVGMWKDIIMTDRPISQPGCSGAPVLLENTKQIVGHVVGGTQDRTFIQRIDCQLDAAKCTVRVP
jgi:hypothetical protein